MRDKRYSAHPRTRCLKSETLAAYARSREEYRSLADKVLYFPHIRVPNNDWFTRALLYWDAVGTIVPHAPPDEVRQILGEHTCGLIDAGLVEPIRARDAIAVPRFDEAFIEMMEADPQVPRSGQSAAPRKTFQLHMTKPGGELTEYLRRRGLLERRPGSAWLDVEEHTADMLMAYLACTIGATHLVQMTPITDRAESLAVLTGESAASNPPGVAVSTVEMTVLEGLLPAPAGGASPTELARFKEEHGDMLRRFRREIESFAIDATALAPDLRQRRAELFRDELQEQVSEIGGRMKRRWPRIIFGTLCGVLAAATPVAGAVAGGATVAAASGVPGLASAIYAAFGGEKKDWHGNSVAYAALAQEQFSRLGRGHS